MTSDGQRSLITVDGERFEVVQPSDSPGTYHLTWLSGPDPEYGFGFSTHPPVPAGPGELEQAVREFLAQVDPATGHIE
ncbi:hypothetical protein [Streptomyces sp. NPDC003832]